MTRTASEIDIFNAPEPVIRECESPPDIVEPASRGGLVLADDFSSDFRVRRIIAEKLANVITSLPDKRTLIIYEAFRPRERQRLLWKRTWEMLRKSCPDRDETSLHALCATFVADPEHPAGSGHQSAAAIDVALGDADGNMLDFGTNMHEFTAQTATEATGISEKARANRQMLVNLMHANGLINYPAEWWHFSYGDRLWAQVTGRNTAFFGPVEDTVNVHE